VRKRHPTQAVAMEPEAMVANAIWVKGSKSYHIKCNCGSSLCHFIPRGSGRPGFMPSKLCTWCEIVARSKWRGCQRMLRKAKAQADKGSTAT
jgi:hypothetical protein